MSPKFIIAGDSYSIKIPEAHNGWCDSWAYTISTRWDGIVTARGGNSNWDIWLQVSEIDPDTPLILNFSHPVRVPITKQRYRGDNTFSQNECFQLNQKAMRKIMSRFKLAWFWTPFPGYEHISNIDTLYFRGDNDLWVTNLPPYPLVRARVNQAAWYEWAMTTGYTGSHLTANGHAQMITLVESKLKEWGII